MKDFFSTHNYNPNFTGRDEILADLQKALAQGKPVALVGPDGSGKTQIAVQYAHVHINEYDFTFWIRARDIATLATDLGELAGQLGLSLVSETDLKEAIKALWGWMEQNRRWLLIFDDLADPDLLSEYLPITRNGHVIVTSSNAGWDAVASQIDVGPFDRAESVQFLQKRTGQEDMNSLDALAKALGDFPLAMELAGAYISQTGTPIPKYLKIHQESLEEAAYDTEYKSLAAIFQTSIEQVQAVSPEGFDLLCMCAFLAPEDIDKSIFLEVQDFEAGVDLAKKPPVFDPVTLENAVDALLRRGLVESSKNSLRFHPTIQNLTRNHLDVEEKKSWAEAALMLVGEPFSANLADVSTLPRCYELFPHILTIIEHAEELEIGTDSITLLLNQVGLMQQKRGDFIGAKMAIDKLLSIDLKVFGKDHPEVATDLNNLGTVLKALGDLEGAREKLETSLAISKANLEPNDPKLSIRAGNLGTVLRELGDLEAAKKNLEWALSIDMRTYGPNHFKTAIRMNNMGDVLRELGNVEDARNYYERALHIFRYFLGDGHDYTKRAQENLDSLAG